MFSLLCLLLLIELSAVAYLDWRDRKISNLWSIFNIILGLLLMALYPEIFNISWEILIYPSIFLVIGFILYLLDVMGAGDAKFLSTFLLLIPVVDQEEFIVMLIYSTIAVGLGFLIYNSLKSIKIVIMAARLKDWKSLKSCFGTRFAYAPVILATWIWFMVSRDAFISLF